MVVNKRYSVLYYTSKNGKNPVKESINSLTDIQKAKIFRMFQLYEEFGLNGIKSHSKHIKGTRFWEIRIRGKDNIRIIYFNYNRDTIMIVHIFIKKSQKIPKRDIEIMEKRYKEVTIDI